MRTFNIKTIITELEEQLRKAIDSKTKPIGALGMLEKIALQIGLIQNTLNPILRKPNIIVFAGDHGVVEEGVSAYPQEVTYQMVYNFLGEGAAINVFCKQNGIDLNIVDAGVMHTFKPHPKLSITKCKEGTDNFTNGAAMSDEHLFSCIERGAELVDRIHAEGCNIIGFGEMGIGNTTSASALMHAFTGIDLKECVGNGTGIDNVTKLVKIRTIEKSMEMNAKATTLMEKLGAFGGFEIAQMVGAMLRAAELEMIVMVDGFISTAAFLSAYKMYPNIKSYALFCHCSDEKGHIVLLNYLEVKPIITLGMRLGEGTGCAVAYPVIKSSAAFLNEMASFSSAGVSDR